MQVARVLWPGLQVVKTTKKGRALHRQEEGKSGRALTSLY